MITKASLQNSNLLAEQQIICHIIAVGSIIDNKNKTMLDGLRNSLKQVEEVDDKAYSEREIFALYGFTDEEIAITEGSGK